MLFDKFRVKRKVKLKATEGSVRLSKFGIQENLLAARNKTNAGKERP